MTYAVAEAMLKSGMAGWFGRAEIMLTDTSVLAYQSMEPVPDEISYAG
jgi:hypothetical protein